MNIEKETAVCFRDIQKKIIVKMDGKRKWKRAKANETFLII